MAGIEDAKTKNLIYHLTQVDNFESIVQNGLLPRRTIIERRMGFSNVADMEIISKRTELGLDVYTPFHFHPYSAFDVAVKNTYDAQRMMYMCVYRSLARQQGFKILPKHPLSVDECVLYDYDEGFDLIDWDTLTTKNLNTDYAKEVKMAECLTEKRIPISWFAQLYVPSQDVCDEVTGIMDDYGINPYERPGVNVLPIWFNY